MVAAPVTVFSARIDPAAVVKVLVAQGASVNVADAAWEEGTATWKSGWFGPRHTLRLQHRAGYYADASFLQQLPGMTQFALRLGAGEPLLAAIRSFRFAVSMVPTAHVPEDPTWAGVLAVARELDGVIATPQGLLDAQGRWLVHGEGAPDPQAVAPARQPANPILVPRGGLYGEQGPPNFELPGFREGNVAALRGEGYLAPRWLPSRAPALRPVEDIVRRMLALNGLFAWATAPAEHAAEVEVWLRIDGKAEALTPRELAMLADPGAREAFRSSVGWRLENLWPLAWVLGYPVPPVTTGGMIGQEQIGAVLEFAGGLSRTVAEAVAASQLRSAEQVAELEDRFYLAHHAVRSAQMGRATVPEGFHPAIDGGVIHERRHALSWVMSPGVSWDDTELST